VRWNFGLDDLPLDRLLSTLRIELTGASRATGAGKR
jgi:hypothetical protein